MCVGFLSGLFGHSTGLRMDSKLEGHFGCVGPSRLTVYTARCDLEGEKEGEKEGEEVSREREGERDGERINYRTKSMSLHRKLGVQIWAKQKMVS